jgi:hypothetical protein
LRRAYDDPSNDDLSNDGTGAVTTDWTAGRHPRAGRVAKGCGMVIGALVIFLLLMMIPALIVLPPLVYYYRKSAPLRAQAELDRTRRARELPQH